MSEGVIEIRHPSKCAVVSNADIGTLFELSRIGGSLYPKRAGLPGVLATIFRVMYSRGYNVSPGPQTALE